MPAYIGLLKGVNVGGKNKVNMGELRNLFEEMGYTDVKTYINSGNILFDSDASERDLIPAIEKEIERRFGVSIPIVLRTVEEWTASIEASPYANQAADNGKRVNIGYMVEEPSQAFIQKVEESKGEDECTFIGRDLHILLNQSAADSKLLRNQSKLGTITVRNWNTIQKLAQLSINN
ncbi:DUF1697 domain-containing protein [Pullulanibacillus sp. KACC 23026]|uniref:DUF1697 domain-containing protein n=1 Tax=Pullulanibacillus sp. KACC 23026 TaxID=3028315 RepID=UPI0023B0AD51|nr:DUF1697 domain-containing protein [Pullulanibacillus sp. KACC 23026]WEG14392.1 DUF1697 domain-containing protein [Pullulanibacillus sp. KACC 23026]